MSAAKKFNPLKDYAEVTPPYEGAVYFQDGNYFGGDGDFLFADESNKTSGQSAVGVVFPTAVSPDADRDYEDKRPLTDSHPSLSREQREEAANALALDAAEQSRVASRSATQNEPAHADEFEGVDPKKGLKAWLKGELDPKPNLPVVREWVSSAYSTKLQTKDEIIAYLVEQNLVPAEQVKA